MNVEFKFKPGQKVITPFGDTGIIRMCIVDQDGTQYYVSRSADSQYFRPDELTAA